MRQTAPILEIPYTSQTYRPVDLSGQGPESYPSFLRQEFDRTGASVLFGGYLEERHLYRDYTHFGTAGPELRDIHLGMDLWAPEGTAILVPEDGIVHSWANRSFPGDYGPVVILQHSGTEGTFHSLYGHLSSRSLEGLEKGRFFKAGECLGFLGSEPENGGYAPHLHFQLIRDMGDWQGDYPGVCSSPELPYFSQNCPDPGTFLGIF